MIAEVTELDEGTETQCLLNLSVLSVIRKVSACPITNIVI